MIINSANEKGSHMVSFARINLVKAPKVPDTKSAKTGLFNEIM